MKYEKYLRDKQANYYEKSLSGYQTSVELFLLRKLLPRQALNILDAGCGTGCFIPLLLQLTKKGSIFCGIDLSLKSLYLAKNKIKKILTQYLYYLSKVQLGNHLLNQDYLI